MSGPVSGRPEAGHDASPESYVLKRNVKRTVSVEAIDGVTRVVKRFHAPGVLDRLRDRMRARRESRKLASLRTRGLPVPAPVDVRKRDGRWELVLEHLASTASLEDLLAGRGKWPVAPERAAATLGKLLGALHEAGVRHDDLHAGNVLLDTEGLAHLVDVAQVRFSRRADPTDLLVALCAGARESTSPGFRARFLVAFLRTAPGALAAPRDRLVEHVESIELRARALRRGRALKRVARWWRESGAMRPFERDGRRGFVRRDLDDSVLDAFSSVPLSRLPGDSARAALAVDAIAISELRPRWETAARLAMHRVPGESPLAIFTHPAPRAVYEVPAEAQPFADAWREASGGDRELLAHSAGRTLGALDDRGLSFATESDASLLATPDGHVELGPGRLVDLFRTDASGAEALALASLPGLRASDRTAFRAGFVAAHRGTRGERRRLERELDRG